ncbi:hypothetical protein QQS21_003966 [Conoideocrella luteorostrata]|uniref:Uncharacterized protein n=1 Tax=Conoideocrella luteorostrata TaxID=1105319 RepID=A0AAJ0CV45_9HYPO|nr:hypothetical protein QQS21_003966 [Conoideocrella luteorostrata]
MEREVSSRNLIIILATTIPSVVLIALAAVLCYRARRRRARLFNRGITPIDDEEIQSWKFGRRASEKPSENETMQNLQPSPENYRGHRTSVSIGSIQKPASVIIYQNPSHYNTRLSEERPAIPLMPSKDSMEMPPVPVLARAPNSRPGLTDDTVQGEDAFITQPRRNTSRLAKAPPSPRHARSKSTRATMTPHDPWYGQSVDHQLSPRRSADTFLPTTTATTTTTRHTTHYSTGGNHSSRSTPPRGSVDEDILLGGLSPRPLIHQSEIGRAIG